MRLLLLSVTTLALTVVAALGGDHPSRGSGKFHGIVVDTAGRPVREATVVIVGAEKRAVLPPAAYLTKADGRFGQERLATNRYRVKASAAGYVPQVKTVSVVEGKTTRVRFVLKKTARK